jgi:hypothetical protein
MHKKTKQLRQLLLRCVASTPGNALFLAAKRLCVSNVSLMPPSSIYGYSNIKSVRHVGLPQRLSDGRTQIYWVALFPWALFKRKTRATTLYVLMDFTIGVGPVLLFIIPFLDRTPYFATKKRLEQTFLIATTFSSNLNLRSIWNRNKSQRLQHTVQTNRLVLAVLITTPKQKVLDLYR